MRMRSVILALAALCGAAISAQAAAPAFVGEQKTLTGTGARALVDACLAHARQNNLHVGIAVVDPYGNLLDYHTMEGTNVIAGESAILKAKTAVRWWRSTTDLGERVLRSENVAPVWIGDFPQTGGVPIFIDGVIIGGMGIGGGRGDACAKAAVAAVLKNASTEAPPDAAPVAPRP
jgi:glc operon protein GlcG